MKLSSTRYKEILNIVRSLLLSNAVYGTLPINILSVLNKYKKNIKCISYSDYAKLCGTNVNFIIKEFGSEHGFTIYNSTNDTYIIAYNDNDNKYCIRWTLAHELGHILLGHLKDENYTFETSCNPESIYEVEANFFSKSFLVPFPILDILHKKFTLNIDILMEAFGINYSPAFRILEHYNKLPYYIRENDIKYKFYDAVMHYISYCTNDYEEEMIDYMNNILYSERSYYRNYV